MDRWQQALHQSCCSCNSCPRNQLAEVLTKKINASYVDVSKKRVSGQMSSITKLKRKFKKIPAFITCAASQSHDSIKTNVTFKVPLQISTELFSVCRLLQKIQQATYKSKEDFKPLSVLTFSRPILHRHRFQSELSEIQSCRWRTKLMLFLTSLPRLFEGWFAPVPTWPSKI